MVAWKPDYITPAQLAAYINVDDALDDTELAVAIAAASRAIDKHCGRQFGKVDAPEVRYYTARPNYRRRVWVVDIDDLATTTGLIVTVADVGTVTTYALEPRNAVAEGKVWTRLTIAFDSAVAPTGDEDEMVLTGGWGWPSIPVPVTMAGRLQGSRFHARRGSPYGIAGSPQQGSELRLLSRVDPDVGVSLSDYVRLKRVR